MHQTARAILRDERAAGDARALDGRGKKNLGSFSKTKSNRIWLLRKLGSFESGRCSLRASCHSRAAARCGRPSSNHRTCRRGGLTPGRLGRHGSFGLRRDVERQTFGQGFHGHGPYAGARRFTGGSSVRALTNVACDEGSFERPSNTQMEPSCPTVLCDPVAAARGSFATLARYETGNDHYRGLAHLGKIRRP